MSMLSEDDLSLSELSDDELVRAWDLWFDLAQVTNDSDPAYSHGVFAGVEEPATRRPRNSDTSQTRQEQHSRR